MLYHNLVDYLKPKANLPETVEECITAAKLMGYKLLAHDDDDYFCQLMRDNPNYSDKDLRQVLEIILPIKGEHLYAEKRAFYVRIANELMYSCFHTFSKDSKELLAGLIREIYQSGYIYSSILSKREQRLLNIVSSYNFIAKGTSENDLRVACYSLHDKAARHNIGLIWLMPELLDLFD